MPHRRLRGAQPAPGRGRRCACSPTPATRRAGSLRQKDPSHHRQPRPARSAATSWASVEGGPRSDATPRRSSSCATLGLPVNPEIQRSSTRSTRLRLLPHWLEHRHDLDYEIDGVVVKVDDLAPARRAGLHVEGAALGDRLQVPARGAHHRCSRTSRCRSAAPGRPRRSPCSSRCSSAARRWGWPRCTTRTRCGPRTCGPATRSSCARPATSSPRSSARCCRCARRACRQWEFPTECPVCGAPLVRRRGRERHVLHQRRLPGPAWPAHRALRVPGRDGHRGLRRAAGAAVHSTPGCSHDPGDIYSLDLRRPAAALEGFGDDLGRATCCGAIEASKAPAAGQPARRAQHPPPRRPAGADVLADGASATSTAIIAATEEELAAAEGVGPVIARSVARVLRRRPQPGGRREAAGGRRQLRRAAERSDAAADAGGHVGRGHRHARGLQPRGGRGGHQGARRQVAGQRVEEDRLPRGGRRAGGVQGGQGGGVGCADQSSPRGQKGMYLELITCRREGIQPRPNS